jgi:3alpha(or 20beta)-hydroxysteroid dehydrogenase
MGRLENKVAIVTGAAQGTGAVITRTFLREGARVVLADVQEEQGAALARELGSEARFERLDVRQPESWASVVSSVDDHWGGVDILINNAAVLWIASLADTSREDFLRCVEVNQLGPFLGIQAVASSMRERGGGSIVNIGSTDGLRGMNGVVAYGSSKWGARGLSRSSAMELGQYRIRVNTLCPEAGNPNMSAPFFPGAPDLSEVPHQMMQQILKAPDSADSASRLEDVAAMALFLASDESQSCTGQDFIVDAGLTAGMIQEGLPRG